MADGLQHMQGHFSQLPYCSSSISISIPVSTSTPYQRRRKGPPERTKRDVTSKPRVKTASVFSPPPEPGGRAQRTASRRSVRFAHAQLSPCPRAPFCSQTLPQRTLCRAKKRTNSVLADATVLPPVTRLSSLFLQSFTLQTMISFSSPFPVLSDNIATVAVSKPASGARLLSHCFCACTLILPVRSATRPADGSRDRWASGRITHHLSVERSLKRAASSLPPARLGATNSGLKRTA